MSIKFNIKNSPYYSDSKKAIGIFFLFILIQYLSPTIISTLFFLGFLVYLYWAKDDEFWIPLLMLMLSAPGYLFYSRGVYHLPVIGFANGRGINYGELVVIVLFLKSFFKRVQSNFFYKKAILGIFLYTFVLWYIGLYYGMTVMKVLFTIRHLIPFTLFWSIPVLLNSREKVYKAINLFFTFSFFAFLMQLVDIIIGTPFAVFLGEHNIVFSGTEVYTGVGKLFDVDSGAVRTIYSVFILTISFITSAYLILSNNRVFSKKYLVVVLGITFLSVFLSATRGWIIGYSIVLLGMYFIRPTQIKIIFPLLALLGVLLVFSPNISLQMSEVTNRLTSLESLAEGDETAGGTLSRLTVRGPKVMDKYAQSPVWGFGYSMGFYENADGHVGNQNLLLNSGAVGYLLYLFFWLFYLFYIYQRGKQYNKSLWIWAFGLLALLAIHSSSAQVFAYYYQFSKAAGLSIIFFLSDFFIKEERVRKRKKQANKQIKSLYENPSHRHIFGNRWY